MNYLAHIKSLIRKAQKREKDCPLDGYYEEHHILPKCELRHRKRPNKIMNGNWNFIQLTAKEHFIMHLLYWKFCRKYYGEKHRLTIKMLHAVHSFANRKVGELIGFKVTSRTYEILKKEYTLMISGEGNPMYGKFHTEKSNEKNSIAHSGENHPRFGKKDSKKVRKNKSLAQTGEKHPGWGKFGEDCAVSKWWKITFDDDTFEIVCGLLKWADDNNYSQPCLSRLYRGKAKYHKDIKKVERLPDDFKK